MYSFPQPFHASSVAVVTVAYRSEEVLPGFLAGLASDIEAGVTVVVADNLPRDNSETRGIATTFGARYVPLSQNVGYGSAVNRAVSTLSRSIEWVLVSNPDVVIEHGVLERLVAVAESQPDIGAVGPQVLTAEGAVYPSARSIPSLRTGVGHALFANFWPSNPWTRRYLRDDARGENREVGWLSGSCVLIRRAVFEEIGGFDDQFFMYFEDVDLGHRLGRAGFRNIYEPSVSVTHTGAHSTKTDRAEMINAHHASARRFLGKKYPGPFLWPLRAALSAGLATRAWLINRNAEPVPGNDDSADAKGES